MAGITFARDLDPRIVLLVPHVVPYAQEFDHAGHSAALVGERFRRLAETLGTEAFVRVCLCRPHSAALVQLLPCDALILVGGRRRLWWRTREERLAAELTRHGRRALFVDQSGAGPWSPFLTQASEDHQVALRIARAFGKSVEDVFTLEE
jgi:hypothetical protein